MNYAFNNEITNTIVSLIRPGNVRSIRVAEKNGLILTANTIMDGTEKLIYSKQKDK